MTGSWDWDAAARRAGASSDGSFNAAGARLADTAVVWCRADGTVQRYSGEQISRRAAEFAAVFAAMGVRRGDRIAGLMGRRPANFAVAMGAWWIGALYVPLFSGFGGEGLRTRMEDCEPTVVVTDNANLASLTEVRAALPSLQVLLLDVPEERGGGEDVLPELLERAPASVELATTSLHEPSTIMYTSGTTGRPKGCLMPHRASISLYPYVEHVLALRPGDVLFSGADAGWSFGLFTSGLAPMSLGVTRVIYEGGFNPAGWWSAFAACGASHLAAAPTAYRQLAAAGAEAIPASFAAATSAGEPLDAPTVEWFEQHTGVTPFDSYGLSELGMVIANLRSPGAPELRHGSMGVAIAGFDVRLVDDDGAPVQQGAGRIAVRDNGFFLSSGYWQRQPEWDERFVDGWFLTEDVARRDGDGRYWFEGRRDDVIVTAGYNVGPVEVESALMAHPQIADAACIGEPDPVKGSIVVAYVVLEGPPSADLPAELRRWAGERVGWHAAPRRVEVVDALPRTDSGKLRRGLLRRKALEQSTG